MLITYRRENGAAETTWEAAFSGYRVLPNGVVDMDADSITLRSETDEDRAPLPRGAVCHAPRPARPAAGGAAITRIARAALVLLQLEHRRTA